MKNEKQITIWGRRADCFHSCYGFISYGEWCEHEIARAKRLGRKLLLAINGKGEIALAKPEGTANA